MSNSRKEQSYQIPRTRDGKAASGYENLDRYLNDFFPDHVKDGKTHTFIPNRAKDGNQPGFFPDYVNNRAEGEL